MLDQECILTNHNSSFCFSRQDLLSLNACCCISCMMCIGLLNPLISDDECTHHATWPQCNQLLQSVLKVGFAVAKGMGRGEVGGHSMTCHTHGSTLVDRKL